MTRSLCLALTTLGAALLIGSGCSKSPQTTSATASMLDWQQWPHKAKQYRPAIGHHGGELRVSSFGSDPKTFNPITSSETSSWEVLQFVFEGLLAYDVVNDTPAPGLASSWTHSPDFLTWDFTLRQDVQWHDGTPFTADDVVFTFEVIYDKQNLSNTRENLTILGKPIQVQKTGSHAVRLTLPYQFAPLTKVLASVSCPILPRHKLIEAQKAGTFSSTWEVNTDFSQIVGTGPFMAASYAPSQKLVLKRNPHYYKKDAVGKTLPYLDAIVFTYVKNISAELLMFQNGESDFFFMRGEDYQLLKPLEQSNDFTIYNLGPQFGDVSLFLNMNLDRNPTTGKYYAPQHKVAWFRNTAFRQALAHCIDRAEIINIVHNGLALPQHSPMNEAVGFFHNPTVRRYEFHLDSARALLAGAGFADRDQDGWLEDSAGNRVEFTLCTNAGNSDREAYCELIRKDLEQVGIKVFYTPLEFNHIVDKLVHTFDWDAIILGMTGSTEPHEGNNVWQSSAMNHQWYPNQKIPSTPWEARIDTLFNLGAQEMDRTKRKQLYDEWQTIFGQQLPYIPIVAKYRLFAVRNRFGNLNPVPLAEASWYHKRLFFHNIEEIYVLK